MQNAPATLNMNPESQYRPRSAYRIYFVSIQTPLVDFFDTHSHHFALFGSEIYEGDTENQL